MILQDTFTFIAELNLIVVTFAAKATYATQTWSPTSDSITKRNRSAALTAVRASAKEVSKLVMLCHVEFFAEATYCTLIAINMLINFLPIYQSTTTIGDLNRHLRSIHLQMKPILCPCCNRKFAKQETLLRHLNTAHRNKPGATSANTVVAELAPNSYTITTQGADKQTISAVANGTILNTNGIQVQGKTVQNVTSLQSIQATLCKVQQQQQQQQTVVDPSSSDGVKAILSVVSEEVATVKASST